MGDGLLSFGGIAVPSDCDLNDTHYVYVLEREDWSAEDEYQDTVFRYFVFKTDKWKTSSTFLDKADYNRQFDIIQRASADIIPMLRTGRCVRILCKNGRNRSVCVFLNVCRDLGMDVAEMFSKIESDYAHSRKQLLKDEVLREVSFVFVAPPPPAYPV